MNWPQRLLWETKCFLMYIAAYAWRRLLFRTTFIAITGSVGKTTAKECLAAILSSHFPTANTWANQNDDSGVPRSILRVRPWHRFAVLEVAANGRGLMRRSAPLVSPNIAVILTVARTHMRSHKTLESVAAEKFVLLKALRPDGTAILNADSSWVAAMAPRCERKVIWFGGSAESNLRAEEVSSCWPERLTFQLHTGGRSWRVKTQLVGTHWTTSLLGALAVAQACGLPPGEALAAVENLQPTPARMQPVCLANGVTILRDEYNSSIDTLEVALRTLADAKARRKVLVMSDVGETNLRSINRMRLIAKETMGVADLTVFVGPESRHALRAALSSGVSTEAVKSFLSLEEAVEYLKSTLQSGDLVLLRGRSGDHLSRIYFALKGSIDCWIPKCSLMFLCDYCPKLGARPE